MNWYLIVEACTAAGTVAMAVATFVLILQNKRQHRHAFRPICVLVSDAGLDASARRNVLQHHEEPNDPTKYFKIGCELKNIGVGPAVALKLIIRFLSNPVAQPQVELSPLGANQSIAAPLRVPAFFNERFNQADYQFTPDLGWELWLVYEDVFGNLFHTRHSKSPQEPWGVTGRGGLPS